MSRLLAQTNIVFSTHEQVLIDFTDVFSATYLAYGILCENKNWIYEMENQKCLKKLQLN